MSVERLTAEDQLMLWPDEIWPQDIGAIAVLDGSALLDADGHFRIDAVRDSVEGRLRLVPRLRQLLWVPPPRLGGPVWVDDPAFDVARHVRVMALPAPGDETQLLLTVEELRRNRLVRSRPLWEMWFLTGLPERRVGLFVRMHHVIADGIAGAATLASLLDLDPDTVAAPAPAWTPAAAPTRVELLADERRRRRHGRASALSMLAHPAKTITEAAATWPSVRELIAEEEPPATSLDHLAGAGRTFALIRGRLGVVKEVAHLRQAKVNDVLLTVTAGGLRALLTHRGELVPDAVMRVYVPVSLRHGQYAGARGNLIAQMVVPLPVGVADPVRRLDQIAAETAARKARSRPSLGKMPHRGLLGRAFLRIIKGQRVNVTTADIPGPPVPLYLAGARVLEVFPVLPLIGKVSLGVGAMSYAGQFNITAVADRDTYPDLEVFAVGVREELHALERRLHRAEVVA
jgi:diacylglycerol O-acyltransferase / wax synthase